MTESTAVEKHLKDKEILAWYLVATTEEEDLASYFVETDVKPTSLAKQLHKHVLTTEVLEQILRHKDAKSLTPDQALDLVRSYREAHLAMGSAPILSLTFLVKDVVTGKIDLVDCNEDQEEYLAKTIRRVMVTCQRHKPQPRQRSRPSTPEEEKVHCKGKKIPLAWFVTVPESDALGDSSYVTMRGLGDLPLTEVISEQFFNDCFQDRMTLNGTDLLAEIRGGQNPDELCPSDAYANFMAVDWGHTIMAPPIDIRVVYQDSFSGQIWWENRSTAEQQIGHSLVEIVRKRCQNESSDQQGSDQEPDEDGMAPCDCGDAHLMTDRFPIEELSRCECCRGLCCSECITQCGYDDGKGEVYDCGTIFCVCCAHGCANCESSFCPNHAVCPVCGEEQ